MKSIRIELLESGQFRVDTINGENKPVPGVMFMPAQLIRSRTVPSAADALETVRMELADLSSNG